MRDLLRSLKGKLELFRRSSHPSLDGFGGGHSIKRVIDLHAIQPAGVILEELLFGQAFGIEDRAPFFVAKTGGPKPNRGHSRIMAQVVNETPVNIGPYHHPARKSRF